MKKIDITLSTLNSYFLDTSDNSINVDYLNDSLIMFIENDQKLYEAIADTKRKITSIVWEGFIKLTQDCINNEYYKKNYEVDSNHLKKFINNDYSVLNDTYNYFEELRKEIKKEKEEEEKEELKSQIDFITYSYNGNDKNGNKKLILNFYNKEKNNINDLFKVGRKTKKGLSTIRYLCELKKTFNGIKFVEI